jgi:Zn-dependent peptidase ImmA (M78 family)
MSKLAHSHQPTMDEIDARRVVEDGFMDQEANDFAMELLMPEQFLLKDMAGLDIADDSAIERLSRKYRVPAGVMAIRIGQLRERKS